MSSPSPAKRQRIAEHVEGPDNLTTQALNGRGAEHTCGVKTNPTTRDELVAHLTNRFCGTLAGKLKCKPCMAAWKEVGEPGELATLQFNRELAVEFRGGQVDQGAEYRAGAKEAFHELLKLGEVVDPYVPSTLVPYEHLVGKTTIMCEILSGLHLYTVLNLYMDWAGWSRVPPAYIGYVTNGVSAFWEDWAEAIKTHGGLYRRDDLGGYLEEYAEDHTHYPQPHTLAFYFFAYMQRRVKGRPKLELAPEPLEYGREDMVAAVGKEMYDELFYNNDGKLALRK